MSEIEPPVVEGKEGQRPQAADPQKIMFAIACELAEIADQVIKNATIFNKPHSHGYYVPRKKNVLAPPNAGKLIAPGKPVEVEMDLAGVIVPMQVAHELRDAWLKARKEQEKQSPAECSTPADGS